MLRIEQSASSIAPGQWKWSVWLEGTDEELNLVREVRYQLHPTFFEPIQVVKDRSTRFRLDNSGWGEFAIYATITQHDSSPQRLQHWLKLGDGAPTKDDLARPQAYLSHSAADTTFATELGRELQSRGVRVARLETLASSSLSRPIHDVVRKTIEEVPAGIVLVSKDSGPWVMEETRSLLANNTVIIPVVLSAGPKELDKELKGFESVQVQGKLTDASSVKQAADRTATILGEHGLLGS